MRAAVARTNLDVLSVNGNKEIGFVLMKWHLIFIWLWKHV
jgi:hypothetical protein